MAESWTEFWGHGILDTHLFAAPAFCHRHLPRFQFMGVHIPTAEFWTPTFLQRLLFAIGICSGFNSWVSTFLLCFFKMQACLGAVRRFSAF